MNNPKLDQRLIAARPQPGTQSHFTKSVMAQIHTATFDAHARTTSTNNWSTIMRYLTRHKIQTAIYALAVIAAVSFSGYAYATGTNPISLIHRIISGDKVEIKYEGRAFEHGKSLTYSDAAVSAYAELGTVWDLHFRASNAFTIPKNGIEYVSPPKITNYQYPWVGTITSVDDANIYVAQQRILGDKVKHSISTNNTVTIPRSLISYYVKGEPTVNLSNSAGQIIEVFQDNYLKHVAGTKGLPNPVVHYFAFQLTHPLKDILEADQTQTPTTDTSQQGIVETSWGGLSSVCVNNGADRCNWQALPGDNNKSQSLYFTLQYYETPKNPGDRPIKLTSPRPQAANNPDVVPFGEMLPDDAPHPLLTRNTEGKVTKISGNTVTIKSSSGALWTFDLKPGLIAQFNTYWKSPLKVGDTLGACLTADLADLDNRHFNNSHIYMLARY